MSVFITGAIAQLTVNPKDITAYVGQIVTMNCNTALHEAVDWRRKVISAERFEIFCFRGGITEGYEEKFSITNPENGLYVLTVKNVQLDDVGEYRCIEGVDQNPNYGTVLLSVRGNNSIFVFLISSTVNSAVFSQLHNTHSCLGSAVVRRRTRDRKVADRDAIKSTRSTQLSIPLG